MTPTVEVIAAPIEYKPAIARLLELYQYDFTEFTDEDLNDNGSYAYRYLDNYWTEPARHPFLFRVGGRIAGFAFVRTGQPHDMPEFFVLRKYRGTGVSVAAARELFARFPGEWQVRELAANTRATAFWRNAIPVPFSEDTNEQGPVQHFRIAE